MVIITPDTPKCKQPFPEGREKLYDHQLSTLHQLRELELTCQVEIGMDHLEYQTLLNHYFRRQQINGYVGPLKMNTQMGVLSSPTGTGKTHPMVALAMEPFKGTIIPQSFGVNSLLSLQLEPHIVGNKHLPSTLIVVPKNIYPQWYRVIMESGVQFHGIFNRNDLYQFFNIVDEYHNKLRNLRDNNEKESDSEYESENSSEDEQLETDAETERNEVKATPETERNEVKATPETERNEVKATPETERTNEVATEPPEPKPIEFPKIILVKHTLYNELVTRVANWSRVILDEADTITIPNSRQVRAGFTWIVTATAKYLHCMGHKGYWREILYGINRYILGALEITISEEYALACLHKTTAKHYNIACVAIGNIDGVGRYLPKKVQEMLAVGDFDQAVKELGGQSHSNDSLTNVIVKYFQDRIDNTKRLIEEKIGLNHCHKALDQRLKDLEERKSNIVEQIEKVNAECSICCEETSDISIVKCCFQTFCTECIVSWMSMGTHQTCPCCKNNNPVIMKISESANKKDKQGSDKSETEEDPDADEKALSKEPVYNKYQTLPKLLEYIFQVDPQSKIIVITSYNLHAFERQLENNNYQFNILNHVSYKRTVNEYNAGISPIILLDAKYNGAGIDLELTTDIIYMQELDPNLMKQTLGRAIRLSRPSGLELRVYHLDSENNHHEIGEEDTRCPIDRFKALKKIEPKPLPKPRIIIRPKPKINLPKPLLRRVV